LSNRKRRLTVIREDEEIDAGNMSNSDYDESEDADSVDMEGDAHSLDMQDLVKLTSSQIHRTSTPG
jgi:hypothetical protein